MTTACTRRRPSCLFRLEGTLVSVIGSSVFQLSHVCVVLSFGRRIRACHLELVFPRVVESLRRHLVVGKGENKCKSDGIIALHHESIPPCEWKVLLEGVQGDHNSRVEYLCVYASHGDERRFSRWQGRDPVKYQARMSTRWVNDFARRSMDFSYFVPSLCVV